MDILSQDIMYLSGVGPHKKDTLVGQLGIKTWGDLLEYYPYKYVDRSKVYRISDLTGDMPFVQIKGKILSYEVFASDRRHKRTVAHFTDGHGVEKDCEVKVLHSDIISSGGLRPPQHQV